MENNEQKRRKAGGRSRKRHLRQARLIQISQTSTREKDEQNWSDVTDETEFADQEDEDYGEEMDKDVTLRCRKQLRSSFTRKEEGLPLEKVSFTSENNRSLHQRGS